MRWKPTWEKKEREFLSENELSNLETYYFPIERLEELEIYLFSVAIQVLVMQTS